MSFHAPATHRSSPEGRKERKPSVPLNLIHVFFCYWQCAVNITHIPVAVGGFVNTWDTDILPRGFGIIEVVLYPIVSGEKLYCVFVSAPGECHVLFFFCTGRFDTLSTLLRRVVPLFF